MAMATSHGRVREFDVKLVLHNVPTELNQKDLAELLHGITGPPLTLFIHDIKKKKPMAKTTWAYIVVRDSNAAGKVMEKLDKAPPLNIEVQTLADWHKNGRTRLFWDSMYGCDLVHEASNASAGIFKDDFRRDELSTSILVVTDEKVEQTKEVPLTSEQCIVCDGRGKIVCKCNAMFCSPKCIEESKSWHSIVCVLAVDSEQGVTTVSDSKQKLKIPPLPSHHQHAIVKQVEQRRNVSQQNGGVDQNFPYNKKNGDFRSNQQYDQRSEGNQRYSQQSGDQQRSAHQYDHNGRSNQRSSQQCDRSYDHHDRPNQRSSQQYDRSTRSNQQYDHHNRPNQRSSQQCDQRPSQQYNQRSSQQYNRDRPNQRYFQQNDQNERTNQRQPYDERDKFNPQQQRRSSDNNQGGFGATCNNNRGGGGQREQDNGKKESSDYLEFDPRSTRQVAFKESEKKEEKRAAPLNPINITRQQDQSDEISPQIKTAETTSGTKDDKKEDLKQDVKDPEESQDMFQTVIMGLDDLKWEMLGLPGSDLKVTVTLVFDDLKVQVSKLDPKFADTYTEMPINIAKFLAMHKTPLEHVPKIGELVLAPYKGEYFRGAVLELNEEATIYFVDYGNNENVPINKLLPIPEIVTKVPSISHLVSADLLIPKRIAELSEEQKNLAKTLLAANTVHKATVLSFVEEKYILHFPDLSEAVQKLAENN